MLVGKSLKSNELCLCPRPLCLTAMVRLVTATLLSQQHALTIVLEHEQHAFYSPTPPQSKKSKAVLFKSHDCGLGPGNSKDEFPSRNCQRHYIWWSKTRTHDN